MNLAAILGICLMSLASLSLGLPPRVHGAVTALSVATAPTQNTATPSAPQAPPAQSPSPAKTSPSPASPTPNSPTQAKPSPPRARQRKTTIPNCSNAPAPLNPAAGNPADPRNAPGTTASNTGSTQMDSANVGSPNAGSPNAGSAPLKPCPPPKKVVRNGGSDQPAVQLTGDTTAEQASHKRASTEQITAATEENLKKA